MPRRITEEELFSALQEEVQAMREELAEAMTEDNASQVINSRLELKQWLEKAKSHPSLMTLKPVISLLRQVTAEVAKAALWLEANPEPDPRPLETEVKETPELQPETETLKSSPQPTHSEVIQTQEILTQETDPPPAPPIVSEETPAAPEVKPVPTMAPAKRRRTI